MTRRAAYGPARHFVSFSIAYIGVFIEEAFGLFIPDVELTAENFDSLEMIAARVEAGAGRR